MLRFRLRSVSGPPKVITIDKDKTVAELLTVISNQVGIPADKLVIKQAFPRPPKVVNLSNDSQKLVNIKSLPTGTCLIVEKGIPISSKPLAVEPSTSASDKKLDQPEESYQLTKPPNLLMTKRVIPSDNSCLFNSVAYALENRATDQADEMRELIAGIVLSDPLTWNEAILGMGNGKYVQKIMQPDTWGGSIELSILAANYECEIAAWDVCSKRNNIFGQGCGYEKRIYLLYDGVHYDVMAQNPNGAEGAQENDITIFDPKDDMALMQAATICENHFNEKKFTNVYSYKIQCNICQTKLRGNEEIKVHAEQTGHTDFVQIG